MRREEFILCDLWMNTSCIAPWEWQDSFESCKYYKYSLTAQCTWQILVEVVANRWKVGWIWHRSSVCHRLKYTSNKNASICVLEKWHRLISSSFFLKSSLQYHWHTWSDRRLHARKPTQSAWAKLKRSKASNLSQTKTACTHGLFHNDADTEAELYLNAHTQAESGEGRHSERPGQRFLVIHMSNAGIPLSPSLPVSASHKSEETDDTPAICVFPNAYSRWADCFVAYIVSSCTFKCLFVCSMDNRTTSFLFKSAIESLAVFIRKIIVLPNMYNKELGKVCSSNFILHVRSVSRLRLTF